MPRGSEGENRPSASCTERAASWLTSAMVRKGRRQVASSALGSIFHKSSKVRFS